MKRVLTISLALFLFASSSARAAHLAHSPAMTIGLSTVEASKISGLFIYPTAQQITVLVERGRYDTSVGAAAPNINNTGDDSATKGGTYSDKNRTRTYTVEITTGGTLGTAVAKWITDKSDDNDRVGSVIPVGGVLSVGTKGITLTFDAGADLTLTLGNKWTVTGNRTFVPIPVLQQFVKIEGMDFLSAVTSAPDTTQPTIFRIVAKKAYEIIRDKLGWIGTIEALDEL